MPIAMKCPGCKTAFEFESALEGKRIKCKSCGDIFRVEAPAKAKRDDDVRPRPSKRRDEDDDRAPRSGRSRRPDDDDDRPVGKSGRHRRPMDDDDEDREPRRSRYAGDDDDRDLPKKKKSPLLIVLPIAGVALLVLVVVVIVVLRKKGKLGGADSGDIVQAPTKSLQLEVPAKDISMLVVPDSGNNFGLLRKTDQFKKNWIFDLYDLNGGRKTGTVDIANMDEPRSVHVTPDGKYLMIMESGGFGQNESTISLWYIPENKIINQVQRWNPYPEGKNRFNAPSLYRVEFLGNDKILAMSTARFLDVWPIPSFDPKIVDGVEYKGVGDLLGHDDHFGTRKNEKYQRQAAISADRKSIAVWNGNGFTFGTLSDGQGTFATSAASALIREKFPRENALDRFKGGPCCFSPDGKILAGIVTHDFIGKRHVLAFFDTKEEKYPPAYVLEAHQFNDAPGMFWWGNRFVVTHGSQTEGLLIDTKTGLPKRQIMGPAYGKHTFGRDGRLWYVVSDEPSSMATLHVVDGLDADKLTEPDDYEQISDLKGDFLRRIWLEPSGPLRKPTRIGPPIGRGLIKRGSD